VAGAAWVGGFSAGEGSRAESRAAPALAVAGGV